MVNYKVLEQFASMTAHFMYGSHSPGRYETVVDYLREKDFALLADLMAEGYKASDIKSLVNSGKIGMAQWPSEKPVTTLFWAMDNKSLKKLEELAEEATRLCFGNTPEEPVGGNFATVGAEMGSQQIALVALTYAREKGKLREIASLDFGCGPLYVKVGALSDKLFASA